MTQICLVKFNLASTNVESCHPWAIKDFGTRLGSVETLAGLFQQVKIGLY